MRILWTACAAVLLAATGAAAQEVPSLLDDDAPGFWTDGLVIGVSVGAVGVAATLGLLYYLGVGGLRHVDSNNVLEHPMRQSLLHVVQGEPGVHLRELANRHGTAVTNTQWHLRKLEMAGLVATKKIQGRRLYYPKGGGIDMRDQAIRNAATSNPNAQAILDCIDANAGINQRNLAEALEMNPGTVRWHLRKLESAGMVRTIQDGTQNKYFVVQAAGRPPRPSRQSAKEPVEGEA